MKNVVFALMVSMVSAWSVFAEVKDVVVSGAPFPLTVKEWTPPARDFSIADYGAKADGSPVTEAVEAAVKAAVEQGGGRVVVPKGEWICGAFALKSNIALVLEKDAVLHFPDDPVIVGRHPLRPTGRPHLSYNALINVHNCTNVAILGSGTLLSDTAYWHRNFEANAQKGFPRPQVIHFGNSKVVRLEGFKVRGSPAWTMHFCVCEDVIMRHIDSVCTGCNSDGLDLESCNRCLVEHCSLDQTDDTYTIKSGMNENGRRRNIPTQNVVIRNCRCVHGHTLLAIGSEISGGIRNIYMTDCTVEGQAWNWLFVKTNSKRGAYVENVWMENIRGRRAENVMNVEMFYDGNPNKELGKKGEKTWPSRIRNVYARNIVCAEARRAVKVNGDEELPPTGLHAENIRVGRITTELTKLKNAPDIEVKDVRLDPAAAREIADIPAAVRLADPAKDADKSVGFDRLAMEQYEGNEVCRQVLTARIAAETARQCNVAPFVKPNTYAEGPETYEGGYSRRFDIYYAECGCAVPGALIADDVRRVAVADASGKSAAYPGLVATLAYDRVACDMVVTLANGGDKPLTDLWLTLHLTPDWLTSRHTFRVPSLAAGATWTKRVNVGVGRHYLPRPRYSAFIALEADFTYGDVRSRLWRTTTLKPEKLDPQPNETALHLGPADRFYMDDAALLKMSASTDALVDLGEAPETRWQRVTKSGVSWNLVSPLARPYTAAEANLVRCGRAWEAVALQFTVPSNGVTAIRSTSALWTKDTVAFLNGVRIPLKGKVTNITPYTKIGLNRLVVKYPSRPGKETGALQLAVYPLMSDANWPCVPFAPPVAAAAAAKVEGPAKFRLDWNPRAATREPLEVEISRAKLARAFGTPADVGFAVSALTAQGERPVVATLLPGRTPDKVRVRFTPPAGAEALFCAAAGKGTPAAAYAVDNLLSGAMDDLDKWQKSPRMKMAKRPDGALELTAVSAGSPEATFEAAVPGELRGTGVRFELDCENLIDATYGFVVTVKQYDQSGKELPELVTDRRWTTLMMAPSKVCHFSERGRLHTEAAKVKLTIAIHSPRSDLDRYGLPLDPAKYTLQRLKVGSVALRSARDLPFPGYDDANFAPGVSGEKGDFALVSGGALAKGFAYQTRSLASWSSCRQLRREDQLFFPAGAGTVEAFFKSAFKPLEYKDGKGRQCSRPIILFQDYQAYRAHECKSGKGPMLQLAYRPLEKRLELVIKDMFGKTYTDEWDQALPTDAWTHLAVQWAPGETAEIFVDGRKVRSLPIPEWKALDLADEKIKVPNDENGLEFYLGSSHRALRDDSVPDPEKPLFDGAIDLLRVSTGRRYGGDFTPAKKFALDGDTRALFDFDRCFDGFSGGGAGWIPATTYSQGAGRVKRDLETVTGAKARYYPREILPENDPRVVFDILNFPTLPTADDFRAARRPFARTFQAKNGSTFAFDCPEGTVADYVEIENLGEGTLLCPVAVNAGDVDARSYGDLADSLGMDKLATDRERVNRVFQFVLASTDYFMCHSPMFRPGSDVPSDVEYRSLFMLNSYCGFECGPLNNMAANLFANVARCPASLTAGYGHEFEQVHFDGKTHIYDLSAQKFFPAMDNETSAYLEEGGDEAGIFARMGNAAEHFIRKSTRSHWLGGNENYPKIGVALRPREKVRVWKVNDGNSVDIITRGKTGVYAFKPSKFRPDYTDICHADTAKAFCDRVERIFPQYSNGFVYFDGAPSAAHPAFTNVTADSFCFLVDSRSYPVVRGDYAAYLKDGSMAALELSTDFGKTFRPLACPATYPLRARYSYLVKVKAPLSEVVRFTAETELQLNTRVYPGWVRPGHNAYTFKCVGAGEAKVTLGGRVPAGSIEIVGAAASGAAVGCEKLFYAYDPAHAPTLEVKGISPEATIRVNGKITAKLAGNRLQLGGKPGAPRFGTVTIVDGGAEKTLTVLCGTDVRFATALDAKVVDGARIKKSDETCPHPLAVLKANNTQAEITFPFLPLKAGKYAVLNLNRFASHPARDRQDGLRLIWPGWKSEDCGSERNWGSDYKKANYGQVGGRGNLKWDFGWHPGTWYPYPLIRVLERPAADSVRFRSWRGDEVEVGAVLVVPDPDIELRCELTRHLCGLNHDPARMHSKAVEFTAENAEIVVEKGAPKTVKYAAAELAEVLSEALGKRPQIVREPRMGYSSIILGDGGYARAAGIDVKTFRRDGFEIVEHGGRIYIAGRDDQTVDPAKIVAEGGVGRLEFERGTLFGVYEFLERFVGARFYFPGELGTVVPKCPRFEIPKGFAQVRAPIFTVRNLNVTGDGAVPGETNSIPWNPTAYGGEVTPETRKFRGVWKARNWLRLRFQTESIPCCHGQRGLDYARRFHATHPEYFALSKKRADGGWDRDVSDDIYEECGTHLCHSSAVWEEFYQDAKAYFSGASAETRGIRRRHGKEFAWGANCKEGRFFDVMPQDGLAACHCEKCQKAYEGQTGGQYATELIWTRTADLARKIGAEFPNAIITQMAYWPYRNVPKCELPPNLWVMVAEYGPWAYVNTEAFERDLAELKRWYEKLGHPVWMWTYPSKFGRKACPGIPDMAPRTWAKTYCAYAPYSMGAFCEVECDNTMYHYLNYYVYSKLAWNPQMDEEKLLDEHFRLMFGAAAPEMAEFYADLERKWTHEVLHIGKSDQNGTRVHVAGEEALYGTIYSPAVCAGWAKLFERAAAKLEKGSIEARRLDFIREQFLDKIVKAAADYARATDITVPHPHDAAKNMLVDSMKEHEIVVTPGQKAVGGRPLPQSGYALKFAQNFEAGCEYKLSYCFELDSKDPWGTFFTQFSTGPGQWINVQKGGFAGGKVKPSYREYVFSTPKKIGPKEKHSFGFYLTGIGRAKVWNVHLEKCQP